MSKTGRNDMSIPKAIQAALEHHQAGRLSQAEILYQQILQVEPTHPDALHLSGLIARQTGKLEAAAGLISKAISTNPSNPIYYSNLGTVFKDQGKFDEAIESYRKALSFKSDLSDVHYNLGVALKAQGRFDEAVESYQRAISFKPDFAEAHHNLGNALQARGNVDEAAASFRRALAINPDDALAHCNLGVLFKDQGKLDEAIGCYHQALSIKPDLAEAHINLGIVLHEQGKPGEAAASYRTALAFKPDYAEAHNNLGHTLKGQGKLDEAVASYQRAVEISPSMLAAHCGMSVALSGLVPSWHVPMMNDTPRNDAYFSALKAAITPDSRVLEIGTGSGLLSMMAAKLGARKVTTCEAVPLIAATAQRIISDNGLDKCINVISRKSSDLTVGVDLTDQADILVTEIFSSELLGENVLSSIEDAKRRLLKPECRVIPAAGSVMIALFGGADIGTNLIVEDACGFNLRHFNSIVSRRQFVARNDLNIELLTGDVEAFCFDFERDAFSPRQARTLRIPVKTAGRCYGIIQWIRLQMDKDTVFENHPSVKAPASSWQLCAYIFPSPVDLKPDQIALVSASHDRICPWFFLDGIEALL